MPITAKLSRKFYDKLGDDVTNELVEWFNKVDATYRADLRELNDLNFARFEAQFERRLGELKADIKAEITTLRGEVRSELHGVHGALANAKADVVKWMFLFWVGTALTVVGLLKF